MAAGKIPAPGSEYGPCADPCQHIDCAQTRAMAATVCRFCGQPIGYDTRLYDVEHQLVHADCYERSVDQERGSD